MAVGTLGSQACVYLINIVATRSLGTSGYGELASLLTVTVIMSIPALALQSWTARTTAQGGDARSILSTTAIMSVLAAVLTGVVVLLIAPHIDTDPVPGAVSAALLVAPLVWLSAAQGFLQGNSRLLRFALVILLGGVGRLVGGLAGLALGVGAWPVVWGIGLATVVVAGVAWALALGQTPAHHTRATWRPVVRIAVATGAMWVLANVDILLARVALSGHESGLYAAGALITRAVQFAPQFVVLSVFAALTDARTTRRVLATAAAKMLLIGLSASVVLVVAGPTLVPLVFGDAFSYIGKVAWLFALLGTLLAVNQLLVAQRVARHDEVVSGVVWLGAAVLCGGVLLWWGGSVLQVVVAGLVVNLLLSLALMVRCLRKP
jgi:O-antigen/teichoic acid export membrane protein